MKRIALLLVMTAVILTLFSFGAFAEYDYAEEPVADWDEPVSADYAEKYEYDEPIDYYEDSASSSSDEIGTPVVIIILVSIVAFVVGFLFIAAIVAVIIIIVVVNKKKKAKLSFADNNVSANNISNADSTDNTKE